MHVGNRWGHGMPSGSFASSSMFGSVSGAGPESAASAFRTKSKQTPARPVLKQFFLSHSHVRHSNGNVPNDAETHPRNRPSPTTPGGRTQGVSAQRNTSASASAEGQSPNTPTPYPRIYARSVCYCNNLMFTPLSVHTTHFNFHVVGR
jgi:hypothetical protein